MNASDLSPEIAIQRRHFITEFLLELVELQNDGYVTQIQEQMIQIDGHIYRKEISIEQIQGVCE